MTRALELMNLGLKDPDTPLGRSTRAAIDEWVEGGCEADLSDLVLDHVEERIGFDRMDPAEYA